MKKYFYSCVFLLVFTIPVNREFTNPPYRLLKRLDIPSPLLQTRQGLPFGGDIRVGDLENNGKLGVVVYRTANSVEGGASQPSFLAALNLKGEILWQKGTGGEQPNRPGPVAIHDIDADGNNEVICLFAHAPELVTPFSMQGVSLKIYDSESGREERSIDSPLLQQASGKGPNWVHQRILIANLRGLATPQDFIIKLGKTIYAFDHTLSLLWTYYNPNDVYQNCPAYIPAVGDVDNDGKDEINGGYYLLDDTGKVLWERKLGKNMDCVLIDYWDNDSLKRAICSGYGFVLDAQGDTVIQLGKELIPHGQELRIGDFDREYKGREMMVRYKGHKPDIHLIGQKGHLIRSFQLNDSPNHTGMEVVQWQGRRKAAYLYNGGTLWNGTGKRVCQFAELNAQPKGDKRQGWYHCIAVDIAGDAGEEIVLYNPWEASIFIYSASRKGWKQIKKFVPTPKQYNPRLMD
ncbi:MAG: hypothetical protein AAF694_31075 [Bacteroidota bacterium]